MRQLQRDDFAHEVGVQVRQQVRELIAAADGKLYTPERRFLGRFGAALQQDIVRASSSGCGAGTKTS